MCVTLQHAQYLQCRARLAFSVYIHKDSEAHRIHSCNSVAKPSDNCARSFRLVTPP